MAYLDLSIRIFSIVFPIFIIVFLGYIYGKAKHSQMESVNHMIMDVFVPALIFAKLAQSDFNLGDYLPLAMSAAAVILLSGVLLIPIIKFTSINPKTFIPPMMFPNAANIGLPLQVLAFGEQALPAAIILLLVFNLLHFSLGIYILDHRSHWLDTLKQPVIIAGFAAILFKLSGLTIPEPVYIPLDMMGAVCIPLMLFSLGVRLTTAEFSDIRLGLIASICAPLVSVIVATMIILTNWVPQEHIGNLILFAVLPPAIMNFLMAEKFNQEPAKVASIVLLSNIFAVITLPIALAYVLPRFA